MTIFDVRDKDGRLVGFEVDNTFVSRWRVCRIAQSIPGARVVKWPRRWRFRSEAEFCEFEIHGARFIIVEAFGDNSRYLVTSEPPAPESAFVPVRSVFAAAPRFDWRWGFAA